MIVWINGAFGVGKSHTAAELVRRVPGAVLCDPEQVGFGIHRMQPRAARRNFQDVAGWRLTVREVLAGIDADGRWPVVVVPMTIIDLGYFGELVGWLRDQGHDVQHVALVASADTIRRRLRNRLSHLVGDTWAHAQLEGCVAALQGPEFAIQIETDRRGLDATVAEVARLTGLTLSRPPLPGWRQPFRRARVGMGLVRL